MSIYHNPSLLLDASSPNSGETTWSSPSNLAIIKYWGKFGQQLPRNPSLSMTLSSSKSITTVKWNRRERKEEGVILDFYFNNKKNHSFAERLKNYLNSLLPIFPFLNQMDLSIESKNTFPHSSGIASSASAMSALAMCLCDIENSLFHTMELKDDFLRKASYISRLGSGSASRSIFPYWAEWGEWKNQEDFSNLWATPIKMVDESFMDMKDTILIASKGEKSVSSSAGHQLMENNDYADVRYKQANQRMEPLMRALKDGDWSTFGKIAENEALTLHALMMSSEDAYILIKPNTLLMIERIRAYRIKTNAHLYFSLDAGPNIHMLYPKSIESEVNTFIKDELLELCEDGMILYDEVGKGPEKL